MKLERGNSPQEVSEMTGTQTGQRNSSGTFENFLLKLTLENQAFSGSLGHPEIKYCLYLKCSGFSFLSWQ